MKKYIAEMLGTMVLVLMGCGSAVFAGNVAGTVGAGVGTLGVALAFGLSVVAMAYAIGGISGCHINPAITLGVFLSGRMNGKDAGMYILFQVIGAVIGSAILCLLVSAGHGLAGVHRRSGVHVYFRAGSAGGYRPAERCRKSRGTGNRPDIGSGSYRVHTYHGHLGQSCPQYRSGPV